MTVFSNFTVQVSDIMSQYDSGFAEKNEEPYPQSSPLVEKQMQTVIFEKL